MSQQPTRRVKPYPATPADDGFPIQMVEPKERPVRDAFLFVIAVAAVFALVALYLTQ